MLKCYIAQHCRVKVLGTWSLQRNNKVSAEEDHSLLYLRSHAFYLCAKKSLIQGTGNSEATKIFLTHTLNQTGFRKKSQQLLCESVLKIGNKIPTNLFFIIVIIFESVTQNIPCRRRGWERPQNSLESSTWARVRFEFPKLGIWSKMWMTAFI